MHGNEVDPWNLTDYEAAVTDRPRRLSQVAPKWSPNAGSKLVIDVMNDIKKRYAFVDLLKPEGPAVVPTLLVLDPTQATKIASAIPSVLQLGWDSRSCAVSAFLENRAPATHFMDSQTTRPRLS